MNDRIADWLGMEGVCGYLKYITESIDKNTKAVSELAINIKALVINITLQEERRAEASNPSLGYNTRVEEEVVEKEVKKNLPRKTKSNPKIDAGAHRISTTTCNQCGGLISWDMRPERKTPLHVDENGSIKGTGDCPEWEGD